MVYSGRAMYKLLKAPKGKQIRLNADPLKDHHSISTNLPDLGGTAVGIDICLDEGEDFDALLSDIREFFRKKKRNSMKKFKRPRFI